MENSFKSNFQWGIVLVFLLTLVVACESPDAELQEPEVAGGTEISGTVPGIDLNILEGLRSDEVFQLMVKVFDMQENIKLMDSLRALTKTNDEYYSLLTTAGRERESVYLPLYELNRSSYPENIYQYVLYECGLRYRSRRLSQPLTRAAVPQNPEMSETEKINALVYQSEQLRGDLINFFGLLYRDIKHPCRVVTSKSVCINASRDVIEICMYNGDMAFGSDSFYNYCIVASDRLQYPIVFFDQNDRDKVSGFIDSDTYYLRKDIMQYLEIYLFLYDTPYRQNLRFDLECQCMPPCN